MMTTTQFEKNIAEIVRLMTPSQCRENIKSKGWTGSYSDYFHPSHWESYGPNCSFTLIAATRYAMAETLGADTDYIHELIVESFYENADGGCQLSCPYRGSTGPEELADKVISLIVDLPDWMNR